MTVTLSDLLELIGSVLILTGLSWAAGVVVGGAWAWPVALFVAGVGLYCLHLLHERARKGKR